MSKLHKRDNLFIKLTLVVGLGFSSGILGVKAIDHFQINSIRTSEREKYKEVLPFLLTTDYDIPLKAQVKQPITVNLELDGEDRKQAIKAIQDLDAISTKLNYKILETNNTSIYADINISTSNTLTDSTNAVGYTQYTYNNRTGYINYPITIQIDSSIKNVYDNTGVSLVDYVVKHEMMHTLGFCDLYDNTYFNKTIMWYSIDSGKDVNTYTELDKMNIKKMYDNELIKSVKPLPQIQFVSYIQKQKDDDFVL